MIAAAAIPLPAANHQNGDPRPVVRCPQCHLNQFATQSNSCRRCRTPFQLPAVPELESIQHHQHHQIDLSHSAPIPAPDLYLALRLLLRAHRNVSQTTLADRIKIPRTFVSKVESGWYRTVTLPTIEKFARALGLTMADLAQEVECLARLLGAAEAYENEIPAAEQEQR